MTPAQYRTAIDRLGLSQVRAAEFLGISIRTSHGYARGEYPVPHSVSILLNLMIEHGISPEEAAKSKRA